MRQNLHNKAICILIIFSLCMGGLYTGISQVFACADNTLPVHQYLSERTSNATETMTASELRSIKLAVKAAKNSLASLYLVPDYSDIYSGSRYFSLPETFDNIPSNTVIIDFIHLQDGQKPIFCS